MNAVAAGGRSYIEDRIPYTLRASPSENALTRMLPL
jgi:hypothetical protein